MAEENFAMASSPCEETYSDIRTDSFDVLTAGYDNPADPAADMGDDNTTVGIDPSCSFAATDSRPTNVENPTEPKSDVINSENTVSPTVDCIDQNVTDSGPCDKTTFDSMGDKLAAEQSHENQSSIKDTKDADLSQQKHPETVREKICDSKRGKFCDSNQKSATHSKLASADDSVTPESKSGDASMEMSSSVKVVTTKSEAGTLQMFLVDDPDNDTAAENSNQDTEQESGDKLVIKLKNLRKNYLHSPKNKKPTAELPNEEEDDSLEKTVKTKYEDYTEDDIQKYDKPSRRSLRLKAGKRSTTSFSYKINSDEEELINIENEILAMRAATEQISRAQRSKSSKNNGDLAKSSRNKTNVVKMKNSSNIVKASKNDSSPGKPYACDQCNVTCRTANNLKQHKETHKLKPFTCAQCNYSCKRKSDLKKHEETHGPTDLYRCSECDYAGKRLKYLKKHMRTHIKDVHVSFSCHLCEYRCITKDALDNHLLSHSNLKPHNCVECGEGFKQKSALNKHMVTHSNFNPFGCEICGAAFKRKDHLKKHQSRHDQAEKNGDGKIVSPQALVGGRKKKKTKDAVEEEDDGKDEIDLNREDDNDLNPEDDNDLNPEDDNDDGDDDNEESSITEENSKGSKKNSRKKKPEITGTLGFMKLKGGSVSCSQCNYTCATKNLLRRHMRRHSDKKPFICSQCGACFKRKDHLKVHKFTHSDYRPHKCPHCSYGTHRKYRLKLHILTHQTVKPVKCSECSYSCRRDCELRYHMRNKHGIEPEPTKKVEPKTEETDPVDLKCQLCDYTCDSQKRMKYHMARHENKTPHSCPHCDYKCSSRSSLTDHLLQHAGIKPCLCSICGMAFRNTSRLNRHKLVHSDIKPHGCDFCDFSSRSKYNLKQHMLRHTDQERARRRNRRPPKPKTTNANNNTEVVKQSYQPDIQTILGQMGSNLYTDNPQPQPVEQHQMTHDSQDSSKFITSPPHTTLMTQYFGRNQMDIQNDHLKQRDRPLDQNSNSGFSTGYPSPNVNINPYHVDRSPGTSAMNPATAYNDPFQHPNPFMSHGNHMPYNPNLNMAHTNPNFCYMDRNSGGYSFPNPYFYNETVFPGNMNPNMNFYMGPGTSSTYPINPSPALQVNQNLAHMNSQVTQMPRPPLVQAPPPLLPVTESKSKPILEPDDTSAEDLNHSEDISLDLPIEQGNDKPAKSNDNLKPPKPQSKKTGATLDGGKAASKNEEGDAAGKTTFICSECGYICLTNTMLQRHKTTHVDLKPYQCDECGKYFKRRDHMKAHQRTHTNNKPFTCSQCPYTCSRKYRLKLHEMTHSGDQPFNCGVCESIFDNHDELKEHMKMHHEGFMFSCDKCDYKCKDKTALRFHTETHKTFLCEKCSYVCRSSREFNSHKRMHADKEELTCSICSYKCDSQKRLKYHMERHENKTPHSCPQCDYKCSSRSSLTDHLLQHKGLKPFLCSICGMSFRNVSRLNRHKMTHTDIKPHACDYCPFSSRSRYNLKQHMLRHFK